METVAFLFYMLFVIAGIIACLEIDKNKVLKEKIQFQEVAIETLKAMYNKKSKLPLKSKKKSV